MREEGFDLADHTPREITIDDLQSCNYMATMGCSILDVSGGEDEVNIRDWDLPDLHGQTRERVWTIRDEIRQRVRALFDELSERSETDM